MKKRLLSGVKPTGTIHIGNYFGAIKQFVDLQDEYECFIFIADLHALNQIKDPKELKNLILETAKTYLSVGLDPNKVTLYRQSDIPEVTELTWIFNSLTPVSLLNKAHAFKDAKVKQSNPNMGLFDYPILMAADILMYDADVVPVGKDQTQHLEIARQTASTFNRLYGQTFKLPETILNKETAIVKGMDGQKMSKSYNNTIELFEPEESIKKKIMAIVTDSKGASEPKDPDTCNIFELHKLFSRHVLDEIKKRYIEGSISYKESKEMLIENILKYLSEMRENKKKLDDNPKYVMDILEKGRLKVEPLAHKKMQEVREKIGIKF